VNEEQDKSMQSSLHFIHPFLNVDAQNAFTEYVDKIYMFNYIFKIAHITFVTWHTTLQEF